MRVVQVSYYRDPLRRPPAARSERPRGGERAAVRAYFERHLSFVAVSAGLRAAYEQLRGGSCV